MASIGLGQLFFTPSGFGKSIIQSNAVQSGMPCSSAVAICGCLNVIDLFSLNCMESPALLSPQHMQPCWQKPCLCNVCSVERVLEANVDYTVCDMESRTMKDKGQAPSVHRRWCALCQECFRFGFQHCKQPGGPTVALVAK